MALVESLLTAIVRADGDALVMHVGEKPYVVASAGPIELSTQGLNLQAMAGMVAQLLPAELQRALTEFGAVEHELASTAAMHGDRFTVVVARGGDDVWIEIRRHRRVRPETAPAAGPPPVEAPPPAEVPSLGDAPALAEVPALAEMPASDEVPPADAPRVEASPAPGIVEPPPAVEAPLEIESVDVPVAEVPAETSADAPVAAAAPQAAPMPVQEAASAFEPLTVEESTPSVEVPMPQPTPAPWAAVEPAAPELQPHASSEAYEVHTVPSSTQPAARSTQPAASAGVPETDATEIAPSSTPAAEPVVEAAADRPSSPAPEPVVTAPTAATASVIPMTRTLRIEVPPPVSSRQPAPRSEIERLLGIAAARGATALYLTTQAPPFLRVDDDVRVLEGAPPLSATDVESAVLELMPETAREALRRGDPTEWVSELADIGRVRCSTFRDYRGPGVNFQLISVRPLTAEQLGLTPKIQALATETEGLILVASPRGHGKTTLIGALVDLINHQRTGYVIALERQIRLVHEHDKALLSQREVRGTADQVLTAARAALSESADVLVIDDLLSAEVFQLALDAAGSGRLVFVSVPAPSTTAALTHILELFPSDQRKEVQSLLAERLRGGIAQALLRKAGGGRVAAREVVLATSAVARVLAEGQVQDLPLAIESGRKHGLVSLTDSLVQFVRSGTIDAREAYRKADDRDALLLALKRENVDTSVVERLA
ncbi:MAG TPA: ATPase, T2SS/T4P/T4SS family [Vicinamibacterales bacterium]|nr:ATPase, T2SS/T4P/T4SS family [Vicinamibacterales bacterium]